MAAVDDLEVAAHAPLATFVSLTAPQLALGRDGSPRVVPVKIDIEGIPRQLEPEKARELATLLNDAADTCEADNDELLPPLRDYCDRYARRFADEGPSV
jgi:hypothetical protein